MRWAPPFVTGVIAGTAFVVVELLARVLAAVPTLPELLQDQLVLLLPGAAFSFLLDHLLYLGKPLFFAGLLVAQLLAGGLVGLALDRWGRPVLVALLLWLLTGVALLPLAGHGLFAASPAVALTTLLAFLVYALTFVFLNSPRGMTEVLVAGATPSSTPDTAIVRLGRRQVLAGGMLGLIAGGLAWRAVGRLPALPPQDGAAASGGTAQALAASPLASGPGAPGAGLPPPVTPVDRFYIVSKNLLDPDVKSATWKLQVTGMVNRPLTLSYGDLLALPSATTPRTLECISNDVGGDLISTGRWTGVSLVDLLQRAGVQVGTTALQFTCADGYTADLALPLALDPATLLVYRLDDQPLPRKHGAPARILSSGTYGMKNPKWVTRIEATGAPKPGFWQQQGWDEQGIVQTMAQFTTPRDGASVPLSRATLAGVAFAGTRGIARVEVSTDDQATWAEAQLLPSLGPNTWTFWQYTWQPARSGPATLSVRCTDGTGTRQPARRTDPFPVGATGYHTLRVRVSP